MVKSPKRQCLERAEWYVKRIDDLNRLMRDKPRMDGDDVEQCQSMLRELLARFRYDHRSPPEGHILSPIEQEYSWAIGEAWAMLRITAASRPTGRWRDDLAACRTRLGAYLESLASEEAHRTAAS